MSALPNLHVLCRDTYKAIGNASRVSNNDKNFVDQFTGKTEDEIAYVSDRDNEIFNRGVIAGATSLLDQLADSGYLITDPTGEAIVPEFDTDEKMIPLSASYFKQEWFDPNT